MQLSNKTKLTAVLTTATCSLLGNPASAEEKSWQVDSAVLVYSEKDRVDAVEPVISVTKTFEDESKLNFKIVYDSLTGASPNGATPSSAVQTFTRPSGKGSYTTQPGEVPLDDTFKDTRKALSAQYEFNLNRLTRLSAGLAYSKEYDYTSAAINASIARDFNHKNTTLTAGFAFAADTIDPEGGTPTPLSSMLTAQGETESNNEVEIDIENDDLDSRSIDDNKDTTDILFGVTQIVNRQTLMQLNYSYSKADGYLTDPFKIVSVIDNQTGLPLDYIYEKRPDSRTKHSLYWKTKYHQLNGNILDLSYRYLWDDWEINSHTLDARYRIPFAQRHYIEPHIRYYTQEEAEFFQHSVVDNQTLPEYVSADPRLGAFDGITYGVKYGYRFDNDSEASFRIEYYEQNGDTVGTQIGDQKNHNLFPDLEAVLAQISYSFTF